MNDSKCIKTKQLILIFISIFIFSLNLFGENVDFELKKVYPKLVTPGYSLSAGQNDNVFFQFRNLNYEDFKLKIFNVEGKNVMTIPISNINWKSRGAGTLDYYIVWDCRDSDNQILEPGTYIYLLETGKKLFNGTITIAR
ncbi:MAG: hypothetical protein AB1633_07460 [Elusimicrobiota bacterium]